MQWLLQPLLLLTYLLGGVDAAKHLGHPQRILPHVLLSVHLHSMLPLFGIGEVLLRLLQAALHLQLLGNNHVVLHACTHAAHLQLEGAGQGEHNQFGICAAGGPHNM